MEKRISLFLAFLFLMLVLAACNGTSPDDHIEKEQTITQTDDIASDAVADWETAKIEEDGTPFSGFISEICQDTNSIYIRTDPEHGFSYAYAVFVHLPADIDAARLTRTSWVDITYTGEPTIVEADTENGYKENTAILEASQVIDFLDYFIE